MTDVPAGTPNFSVILPGKCNCRCGFCFWEYDKSPEDWLPNLITTIHNLPPEYVRCSVSGGEPTLSPVFEEVFDLIANARNWEAIVLTTNGTHLAKKIDYIRGVNHLNLSRHHHYEEINQSIFKTKSVPKADELRALCTAANNMAIDVNLNCVLVDQFKNRSDVENYIKFAKEIGANSICFRQDQGLNSTEMPKEMEWFKDIQAIGGWACAACKIFHQYIFGMKVAWKAAIAEPSIATGQIYEIVYHQNGVVSSDWGGKQLLDLKAMKAIRNQTQFPAPKGGTPMLKGGGGTKRDARTNIRVLQSSIPNMPPMLWFEPTSVCGSSRSSGRAMCGSSDSGSRCH